MIQHMLCSLVKRVNQITRIPESRILVIFLLDVFVNAESKLAFQMMSVPFSEHLLRSVSFYVIIQKKVKP